MVVYAVLAGLVVVSAVILVPRFLGGASEAPRAVATAPEVPVASPSPSPSPADRSTLEPTATPAGSPTPTPTPSVPDLPPDQTVLFRGGPAHGPWQQLGTVAEITHPDAPPTARVAYERGWSDPAEENQPPELWDQLVREVTAQLVELGEPVDRPAFGASAQSEAFNSFGGMEDVYRDDRVFTATWSGVYDDGAGVAQAFYPFVIDFDANVIHRDEPFVYRESDVDDFRELSDRLQADLRAWATSLGYSQCERC
jgi:hypothetical protein